MFITTNFHTGSPFIQSLMRKNYQSFVNYDQSRTWKAVSGDYVGKGDIDYSFIRLIDETIIERKRFDDDGNLLSKYHTFKDRTVLRIRRAADSDFIELSVLRSLQNHGRISLLRLIKIVSLLNT